MATVSRTRRAFYAEPTATQAAKTPQERFTAVYGYIHRRINKAFERVTKPADNDDFRAEAEALVWRWFAEQCDRGEPAEALLHATIGFAITHARSGRSVRGIEDAQDILSHRAARSKGFTLTLETDDEATRPAKYRNHRLNVVTLRSGALPEPSNAAAYRIDFPDWLERMDRERRARAMYLAIGNTTNEAADHFKVTPGAISQLRTRLRTDWHDFTAAPETKTAPA